MPGAEAGFRQSFLRGAEVASALGAGRPPTPADLAATDANADVAFDAQTHTTIVRGAGGFFLLPQLPAPGQSATTSPVLGVFLGAGACLGVAALCGLATGGLIVALRVHPFIITLGGMAIYRGIAFVITKGQSVGSFPAAFRDFVKARIPADCRVEFTEFGSGRAVAFEVSSPVFQKTQGALSDEWGVEAAFVGGGGSIPVTTMIKEKLGMDVVMAGFGLSDDRIHSPNEKYNLESFQKGIRSWARVLDALSR